VRKPGEHRWWKAALVVLCTTGLATCVAPRPGFWSSYVLDMVGPAWNYILLRGLFSKRQPAMLSNVLSPTAAVLGITAICFLIEAAQYFRLYEAHFDPYDLLAYVSLLWPCYLVDQWLRRRRPLEPGPTATV